MENSALNFDASEILGQMARISKKMKEDHDAGNRLTTDRIKTMMALDERLEELTKTDAKQLKAHFDERYKIFQPIKDWCEKYYYADFLVTIKADEWNCTTVLYGGDLRDHDTYSFLDDWDEGQNDIELIGFIPIDSIEVHVNGENLPSNVVLHLYEDRANYETAEPKGC